MASSEETKKPQPLTSVEQELQEDLWLYGGRGFGKNARWFALSAAASVMALALVGWMSAQVGSEPPPQMAMQRSDAIRPASLTVNKKLNDYLMAHQEFSPSADVQGAASYMRTVAGQ